MVLSNIHCKSMFYSSTNFSSVPLNNLHMQHCILDWIGGNLQGTVNVQPNYSRISSLTWIVELMQHLNELLAILCTEYIDLCCCLLEIYLNNISLWRDKNRLTFYFTHPANTVLEGGTLIIKNNIKHSKENHVTCDIQTTIVTVEKPKKIFKIRAINQLKNLNIICMQINTDKLEQTKQSIRYKGINGIHGLLDPRVESYRRPLLFVYFILHLPPSRRIGH